jgi:iron-sulfur cluster insertion protein
MSEIKAAAPPVGVSASAARRVAELIAKEPGKRLRLSVSGGGCSGFQYGFELDSSTEEGDVLIERDGAEVVVDGMSQLYLAGAELDWVEDLTGSYFRVNNPNASSSCGCGTSFSI